MRVLEGSSRVRNGLMGIIFADRSSSEWDRASPTCPCCSQSRLTTPSSPIPVASTPATTCASPVSTSGRCGPWRSTGTRSSSVTRWTATEIGTDSRAAIRTDTILGKRNVEIEPRGSDPLRANGVLPLGQTTTPYQIYDAFFDVSNSAQGWDTKTVKESLNVLSETIDQTYPHLSAALDGVARFSDTIGKRDDQITQAARQREQGSRCPRQPQRADQPAVRQRPDPAGRGQRAQLRGQPTARARRVVLRSGQGSHRRQPQPQPRSRTAQDDQRRAGRAQVRPRRRAVHTGEVHRVTRRGA